MTNNDSDPNEEPISLPPAPSDTDSGSPDPPNSEPSDQAPAESSPPDPGQSADSTAPPESAAADNEPPVEEVGLSSADPKGPPEIDGDEARELALGAPDTPSFSTGATYLGRFRAYLAREISQSSEFDWAIALDASHHIDEPSSLYIARLVVRGCVVGGLALFASLVIGLGDLYINGGLNTSAVIGRALAGAIIAFALGVGVAGVPLSRAYYQVLERKRRINLILPDSIAFMHTQASGGTNILDIIKTIAQSEDSYGEIAREFQLIVRDAEHLGVDYRDAIQRQAHRTPSEELQQFLLDLLGILRDGSDINQFLNDQRDEAFVTAKTQQTRSLGAVDMVATLYLMVSLFPVMIVWVMIFSTFLTPLNEVVFYAVIYGAIPLLSIVFVIVVMMADAETPEPGLLEYRSQLAEFRESVRNLPEHISGFETAGSAHREISSGLGSAHTEVQESESKGYAPHNPAHPAGNGILRAPALDAIGTDSSTFKQIKRKETVRRLKAIVTDPINYFQERPAHTFFISIPVASAVLLTLFSLGLIPHPAEMASSPVLTTFWWVHFPILLIATPVAINYELGSRAEEDLLKDLPASLRQIGAANESGRTLMESIGSATRDGDSLADRELHTVYQKAKLGMPVDRALIEFSNKYRSPEISRIVSLLSEAQRATDHVPGVIQTTVELTKNRLELIRDRRTETQDRVFMIVFINIAFLGINLLIDQSIYPTMAETTQSFTETGGHGGAGPGPDLTSLTVNLDAVFITMILLHGITIHAVFSGIVAGLVRNGKAMSGLKYSIAVIALTATIYLYLL